MTSNTPTNQAMPFAETDTLNLIVASHPAALTVLQRFGLDTCCGGMLSLREAVAHHGLSLADVKESLRAELEAAP